MTWGRSPPMLENVGASFRPTRGKASAFAEATAGHVKPSPTGLFSRQEVRKTPICHCEERQRRSNLMPPLINPSLRARLHRARQSLGLSGKILSGNIKYLVPPRAPLLPLRPTLCLRSMKWHSHCTEEERDSWEPRRLP